MKNLGFISPETFQVNTIINEVKSIMLFQEHANKELLEKNNREEKDHYLKEMKVYCGLTKIMNYLI